MYVFKNAVAKSLIQQSILLLRSVCWSVGQEQWLFSGKFCMLQEAAY